MAAQRQPALNILMVGKTGVGKSATGNSLLGSELFASRAGRSKTKECKEATATRDGVQITVIDTPGVFDTDGLDAAKVIDDYITTKKCELHAIFLVIGPSRPTAEENQAIEELCKLFGMAMLRYLFIVITRADDLDREGVKPKDYLKDFLTTQTDILKYCIQQDRVFGIDNFNVEKKKQHIQELLKTVNMMVSESKGAMYTHHILEQNKKKLEEEARRLKEKTDKIDNEKAEHHKREIELEKNKAREEERQVLQKEMEALKKKEEAIEEQKKQLVECVKKHNSNAERMGLWEKAMKAVLRVTIAGATTVTTTPAAFIIGLAAAPVIGLAAAPVIGLAAAPVIGLAAAPVVGAAAGLAGAYIIKNLFP